MKNAFFSLYINVYTTRCAEMWWCVNKRVDIEQIVSRPFVIVECVRHGNNSNQQSGFVMVSKLQHSTFCSNILDLFRTHSLHFCHTGLFCQCHAQRVSEGRKNTAIPNMQWCYYFPWSCLCFLFGFQLFPFLILYYIRIDVDVISVILRFSYLF